MWVTENGFHRGSVIEMSLEGWAGFHQVNDAEESLDDLHEYSFFFFFWLQAGPANR